ncbi:hypothetical protein SDC9_210623 [bioreactor metagenome]|uniref:Uncharacterized protein n=1 Tax=bioreactor metagenome TaxID=1076179 RepID=A0A645JIC8_9ZZZZ
MPTGNVVKKENPRYPASTSVLCTIRIGGVPISVIIPPILLAKAIGINKRRALMLEEAAILTTMGISNATVPVLLNTDPISAVTDMTSKNNL